MLYEYKQQLLMRCERGKEECGEMGGEGGVDVGKGRDEEMIRRMERWVNKKNERMIHHRPAELEKVEQWEKGRDSLRRLEKVNRGERLLPERQNEDRAKL